MTNQLFKLFTSVFFVLSLINCSGGDGDEELKGYLQEESVVPDYDNDPIYSKSNAKNLPSSFAIGATKFLFHFTICLSAS